jgi:hypothetical protein
MKFFYDLYWKSRVRESLIRWAIIDCYGYFQKAASDARWRIAGERCPCGRTYRKKMADRRSWSDCCFSSTLKLSPDPDTSRDLSHLANAFGYDPAELIKRHEVNENAWHWGGPRYVGPKGRWERK